MVISNLPCYSCAGRKSVGAFPNVEGFAGYGDSAPTFGISISPWVLALGAAVFLAPKIIPLFMKKR